MEEKNNTSLFEIENPSRYFGPEFFVGKKSPKTDDILCAMCFPDLYEIGMSNNAMRILYDLINRIDGVFCDRVFAVAPDFEKYLRDRKQYLFTIQEQIPIKKLDYIGITLGTELCVTNILQILDLGGISLHTDERRETDPVIILGGPAATNPLPFGKFVDFVHIGEGEADTLQIINVFKNFKTRTERINALKEIPYLWYPGKTLTTRAMDSNFGTDKESPVLQHFVVPSFETAQDHGVVEIMRGCPNGCRFCHAGQYYKPFRQRNIETISKLVKQNVDDFGYREITLSSLSSGDYPSLNVLMKNLNSQYKQRRISFSLPSLKVSTFSLDILQQLSEVRKSGLTYAIETPVLQNQRSMNKEVLLEDIISIINEAKSRGWKLAKFYFMVGLPFVDESQEEHNIVEFLSAIRNATKINMNINIGTFIPKAHTPFQWARQLTMEESSNHLKSIKRSLMAAIPGIKVSYHEPSISFLEGIISRGDSSTADLIEKAYLSGCRLDAWDEYMDFSKWENAIAELNYNTNKREYTLDEELPWDCVSMNVSKEYYKKEWLKASKSELTSTCNENCDHRCGVCSKNICVKKAENLDIQKEESNYPIYSEDDYEQVIFVYEKKGRAVFNSHIAVMRQFEMAFQRSKLNIHFTEGFNPKPRMEFLNPLSMGIEGDNELLLTELPKQQINDKTIEKLNSAMAEGFTVKNLVEIPKPSSGKKYSLSSMMTGSVIQVEDIKDKSIENCLESKKNSQSNNYSIVESDGKYKITVNGEKNYFKLLFPEDLNKFYIAGNCKITRLKLNMNNFLGL